MRTSPEGQAAILRMEGTAALHTTSAAVASDRAAEAAMTAAEAEMIAAGAGVTKVGATPAPVAGTATRSTGVAAKPTSSASSAEVLAAIATRSEDHWRDLGMMIDVAAAAGVSNAGQVRPRDEVHLAVYLAAAEVHLAVHLAAAMAERWASVVADGNRQPDT
mmetsp:Transcript_14971/g.26646  ORF Transcript_14971/g.26646 Transcript_14971/m.26646 type:complete len:162 (+) Transcript_14971:170-655(+)